MKITQNKLLNRVLKEYSLPKKRLTTQPYPYALQKPTTKQPSAIELVPIISTSREPTKKKIPKKPVELQFMLTG
jgi:hypothetical protein